ncbi:MAG: hypothetical protein ACREU3_09575 [Steroidobacteraceae bacterium]
MPRLVLAMLTVLAANAALAQLKAPTRELSPVANQAMTINDRGAQLEVLPTQRAIPQVDPTRRRTIHRLVRASASSPIGPATLGVVYNHAMQEAGVITGEITFQVKGGHAFSGSPAQYPGLRLITRPAVYAVYARTPAEFIQLMRTLKGRSDLAWVEPTVIYGSLSGQPTVK